MLSRLCRPALLASTKIKKNTFMNPSNPIRLLCSSEALCFSCCYRRGGGGDGSVFVALSTGHTGVQCMSFLFVLFFMGLALRRPPPSSRPSPQRWSHRGPQPWRSQRTPPTFGGSKKRKAPKDDSPEESSSDEETKAAAVAAPSPSAVVDPLTEARNQLQEIRLKVCPTVCLFIQLQHLPRSATIRSASRVGWWGQRRKGTHSAL